MNTCTWYSKEENAETKETGVGNTDQDKTITKGPD